MFINFHETVWDHNTAKMFVTFRGWSSRL